MDGHVSNVRLLYDRAKCFGVLDARYLDAKVSAVGETGFAWCVLRGDRPQGPSQGL